MIETRSLTIARQAFGSDAVVFDGIAQLSSNRPYAHAEGAYDAQYENASHDLEPGRRLIELLREFGIGEAGRLLEIGCGTGFLSLGLAASNFFKEVAITDGSLDFLRIIKRKFAEVETRSDLCLAVLTDEDVEKISDGYFDVIAMRSVLHHVTDFNVFADMLLRKLRAGGILAMYEPRAEMFLWMGTVMALFVELAPAKGILLDDADLASIDLFVRTMQFYLRRDMDKSAGEDKYAFWQTELLDIAIRNHSMLGFRSERGDADLVDQLVDYCQFCMAFQLELVAKIRKGLEPLRETIAGFMQGTQPPSLAGWYIMKLQA